MIRNGREGYNKNKGDGEKIGVVLWRKKLVVKRTKQKYY